MKSIKPVVNEYENRFIVGEIGSDKIEVLKQYQLPELLDVYLTSTLVASRISAQKKYDELQSMEKNMQNYPTLFLEATIYATSC
jgi:trehalose-6-phosphate hydrolase